MALSYFELPYRAEWGVADMEWLAGMCGGMDIRQKWRVLADVEGPLFDVGGGASHGE